ncbi:MAG TPA: hypothetical protein VGZ02_05785 [Candidatus Baltobacteraceae bacterium]|jgi:hypothetical protein|nr:hypothetical protein [Candidatus Baltobacteraceae bacterium]
MGIQKRLFSPAAAVISLALITGCAGGGSQIPASSQGTLQAHYSAPFSLRTANVNYSAARLGSVPASFPAIPAHSYNACPTSITFVSDFANNVVYMLSGVTSTVCGTITGLVNPQGMALDASGNLWIANTGASNVLKYAPPYTTVSRTLSDPFEYPTSVAVCKGYIAVTNIETTGGKAGNVAIYKKGSKPAAHLKDTNAGSEYFGACDTKGNLFTTYCTGIAGVNCSQGGGRVNEWKGGTGTAIELSSITLQFPGGLDYEDGSLLVDDQLAYTVGFYKSPYATASKTINISGHGDPVTIKVTGSDKTLLTTTCCETSYTTAAAAYTISTGAFLKTINIPNGSNPNQPIGVATNKDDRD